MSTSNLIFIPWVGIEPTYQKQQVISLLSERNKSINKLIYWFKLFFFFFVTYVPPISEHSENSDYLLKLAKTVKPGTTG